jgi:ATP-dependent DNA helicase RecG
MYIKTNEGKRVSQISEALKIPQKTIERWILALRSKNKIEFKGSKKTGGYYPKI